MLHVESYIPCPYERNKKCNVNKCLNLNKCTCIKFV